MVTQKAIAALIAAAIFFLSVSIHAAEPIASIDRSRITIDDMLTLTIRINDTSIFSGPDTGPLQKDFEVLSTRQSSRHSIVNGKSESSTEWQISLLPRSTGNLRIPPISVGDKTTEPLTVFVEDSRDYDASRGEPVFLESEINTDTVYVQQQLLFTVRVFLSIQLDNLSLSDIEIEDTLIEKLSQNSFQRRINNRLYRIHEIRYALFPQKMGKLTIPEVIFRANRIANQRSMFSLPGQGQPIRKMTRQHEITVLAPPQAFTERTNATWLPAQDIQLVETWGGNIKDIKVGDSITRTITLKARGLLASQLPPVQFEKIEGARFYPDQGQLENSLTEQGASSVRIDSTAIIPTREGELRFPSITVQWWDTDNNRMRSATIAGQTLHIVPAPPGKGEPLAVDHRKDNTINTSMPSRTESTKGIWPWTSAFFALLWFITLSMWWQARKNTAPGATSAYASPEQSDEKTLFRELVKISHGGDFLAVRKALIKWAQALWPKASVHTLDDIERLAQKNALSEIFMQLDTALYGQTGTENRFNGDALITLLKEVRDEQRNSTRRHKESPLPSLYPSDSRV